MDDVLSLISATYTKDKYGVDSQSYTEQTVFCQVLSVTRSEFFEGGRNGLNPEFSVRMFAGDYKGETICRFHGQTYSIYRTYRVPGTDTIELYVERRGGTNGIQTDSNQ